MFECGYLPQTYSVFDFDFGVFNNFSSFSNVISYANTNILGVNNYYLVKFSFTVLQIYVWNLTLSEHEHNFFCNCI